MPDFIRETPYANPLTGLSNDVIQGLLGYMKDKQRTQQMQGLASLLESTGIPKTVERAAYAESPTGLLNALTNVNRANVPLLKPETADALMTLAPVPSGTNKAAMAVGRAGERYAEKVVPQIMERGGLPAEMIQAMGTNTRSLLDVYHGSPHGPFNKFDPSKARTGEGNASYGEGAYLAEARGTGEAYRKNLSDFDISVDGKPFNSNDISHLAAMSVSQAGDNKAKALNTLKEAVKDLKSRNVKWADDLASEKQKEIDYLSKAKEIPKYEEVSKGYLYKVDLPDEAIPKMLDWDKPLSLQTPEVRAALEQLGYQVDKTKVSEYEDALLNALLNDGPTELPKQPLNLSGEAVYNKLKSQGLMASDELQNLGITGIRYLDQASRGVTPKWVVNIPEFGGYDFPSLKEAQDFIKTIPQYKAELIEPQINTSNFVVFPKYQDLLTIKEINDRPITSLLE